MMRSETWRTRPEELCDASAIRALLVDAFTRSDEAELVDRLRADKAWIEGLSWVATTSSGDVIAHALMTRCTIRDSDGTASEGLCLAPCAVVPEFQRRGAGTAVIESALAEARRRGERFVVVLGHPEYYPRFGFERAADFGISVALDVRAEALMVLQLAPHSAIPAGRICYAEPFGIAC